MPHDRVKAPAASCPPPPPGCTIPALLLPASRPGLPPRSIPIDEGDRKARPVQFSQFSPLVPRGSRVPRISPSSERRYQDRSSGRSWEIAGACLGVVCGLNFALECYKWWSGKQRVISVMVVSRRRFTTMQHKFVIRGWVNVVSSAQRIRWEGRNYLTVRTYYLQNS